LSGAASKGEKESPKREIAFLWNEICREDRRWPPAVQNPFDGVEFEPRPSLKYRSTFDIGKLEELKEGDPEACKVFFLAAAAGLGRGEIDALEWSAFLWNRCVIHIGPTKQLKTEHSIGDVEVDAELMEIFQTYASGNMLLHV
jgi:hypothetical protein